MLAGLATATGRIRLGSAVVVLSSDDPIRVYERFATIDALSGGRAEPVLGRGSFIESFGLYGFDLADYEKLFEETLEVFSLLREEGPVTWSGTYRTPLADVDVFPKTEGGRMRSWVAVGGSPQSVVRAAHRGFGLQLAIIGGPAQRFKPFADLYRRAVDEFGVTTEMPVAVHSPGPVAETDELAAEQLFPHFKAQRDRIGRERGWGAMGSDEFTNEIEHGALYVGSPETVAAKIAATVRTQGRPVRPEGRQRAHAAQPADEVHRAVRHARRPAGAGDAGLTLGDEPTVHGGNGTVRGSGPQRARSPRVGTVHRPSPWTPHRWSNAFAARIPVVAARSISATG